MERRFATRTVLLDGEGKVAILRVNKLDYYKIPGGGVEKGEGVIVAAKREVTEEAGCDCEIIGKLGRVETDILGWKLQDVSDGFVAKVVGEKVEPKFDDYEAERGFELMWVENLAEAVELLQGHVVADEDAVLLQARDLEFLRRAAAGNRLA